MKNWQNIVSDKITNQKNKVVYQLDLQNETVEYSEKIKQNRNLKSLTGDEEIVRAFLIDRLVNELNYKPDNIELEKEYQIKGGHNKLTPRIDLLVKDNDGNPFFFVEIKAPDKFETDKKGIEGQLFALAQAEQNEHKTQVKYLVYYTADFQNAAVIDKAIIIDFIKYPTYKDWENAGSISIGLEMTANYNQPQKTPLTKKGERDLRDKIDRKEIDALGKDLHNKLWGGGGTSDSEIFYSLINIILAKLQDELERNDNEEYHFQVYQYGNDIENLEQVYERVNALYKRALKQQMYVSDQKKIDSDNVINQNKLSLDKLIYAVQRLETISFLEGRNSLNGKDILGDFFETITRDGFKQNKGQFFTPTPIVKFLLYALQLDDLAIQLLNNNGELPLIIDPSAGSGTYLIEAMKLITKELKYKQKHKINSSRQITDRFDELFTPDYKENKWARHYLYATENSVDLGTASKVNMVLHGDGATNIFVKDGLLPFRNYKKEHSALEKSQIDNLYNNKEVNEKFDVVISNPPFSVDLTQETLKNKNASFIFGDKKNSENLFIERYYQLLKEGGRLGVVLPESVFDTTENKYIRLFLFKYFNIKAVVSLPQITFEPHTSTKTSILFAQKKTKEQIQQWNALWDKYGKEWSRLKTRVLRYYDFFVLNAKLNKKYAWVKELTTDLNDIMQTADAEAILTINNQDIAHIKNNICRFLKDYITPDDQNLAPKELLTKYSEEITALSKHDKEHHVFGFYNAWWVFGEVAQQIDNSIFMAEAENVSYKRTIRSENPMPNDLYDIEHAPNTLDTQTILNERQALIDQLQKELQDLQTKLDDLTAQITISPTDAQKKKIDKHNVDIADKSLQLHTLQSEHAQLTTFFNTYYAADKLKPEYTERTDQQLISYFKNGLLSRYQSTDIVLRKTSFFTILDHIRNSVLWD